MHFYGSNTLLRCKAQLILLAHTADRNLCVDQDWWAGRLGWDVRKPSFGARVYRDPRFDIVREVEDALLG